jgi:hypothetical protein
MENLSGIVKQLKTERDRVRKQLLGLETAFTAFASAYSGSKPSRKRRKAFSEGPSEDCSRTESTLGEGQEQKEKRLT